MTDWGDVGTWAAAAVGMVTGVSALLVSWSTRNQTKRQTDQMAESNTIARKALRLSEEANRSAVEWSLNHAGGDRYLVKNIGDAVAWDVSISHEGLVRSYNEPTEDRLTAGEGIEFMAAVHMQTRDNTVYVRWRAEPNGEQQTWRHPLPAKSNI